MASLLVTSAITSHAGLVGWWKLDQTSGTSAIDSSASGNNGTLVTRTGASGSPLWVNDAERGQVLALDGHGDVQINTAYPSLTNAMSISFWVKGNSTLNKATAFTAMDGNAIRFRAQIPRRNREIRLTVPTGSESYNTDSTANLKNAWHHWVFVVDATTKDYLIYLDGELEHSGQLGGSSFDFSGIDKLRIGSNKGTGRFYDGRMSDFRIYNHALTFAEISTLFNPQNQAPVAADDTYLATENTQRVVSAPGVLGNDADPNGDSLTAVLVNTTPNGTLNLASDGSFNYQPNSGFTGTDQFTYKANDGDLESAPATVTITVQAVGTSGLTVEELQKIQADLGVTLTIDQQLSLAAIVKPNSTPQWRTDAEARINQHRKASFNAVVVDANGLPVPGAQVDVTLRKKQFRFGGIMNLKIFAGADPIAITPAEYKSRFLKYFDHAGLNNGLKPKLRNGFETYLPEYFSWLNANDMESRGHLLMWPGGTHMSANIDQLVTQIENETDPATIETLKVQLRTAINNEITEWAGLWNVDEWDVVNEVLTNHRVQDILGQSELISWFNLARNNAVNPNAKLLINDYQIVSAKSYGSSYQNRSTEYKAQIQYLIDNNAELDKIGFQSRFKFENPDPALLYQRMEEFATFGLPMVGTEFEVKDQDPFIPSENERAEITEKVMTIYFSHPMMEGLFAWDYILPGKTSSLANTDGTPKLNGLVWYYLNRIRYHTETSTHSDHSGNFTFEGFKGEYDVSVTVDGQTFNTTTHLTDNSVVRIPISYTTPTTTVLTTDALEDAHARESQPTTSFPDDPRLQMRSDAPSIFTRHVFIKFNVSGIQGSAVRSLLRLTSENATGTVFVYAVADNSWTESTINWINKPVIGILLGSATASPTSTFDIDLGNHVTTDGTVTLALKYSEDTMHKLISSEGATPPQLRIISTSGTPPTATEDHYTLDQGSTLNQSAAGVLTNDSNPSGGSITARLVSDVSQGTLILEPNGSFSYTPDSGFWGWDTFTYQATNVAGSSSTVTVNLAVVRSITDTDSDDLDDDWETTHAGNLTTMNATSDKDQDGQSDLDEFRAKTNPGNPSEKFTTTHFAHFSGDQWTITWTSKPGLRYRVLKSDTMQTLSWTIVQDNIPSAGSTTSLPVINDGDRDFYRVQVLEPSHAP